MNQGTLAAGALVADGWHYSRIDADGVICESTYQGAVGQSCDDAAHRDAYGPAFDYVRGTGEPQSVRRYLNGHVFESHIYLEGDDLVTYFRSVAAIDVYDLQTVSRLSAAVNRVLEALAEPASEPPGALGVGSRTQAPAGVDGCVVRSLQERREVQASIGAAAAAAGRQTGSRPSRRRP